jgi:hypothetical protein
MTYSVAKAFKSLNRRFAVGDAITAADIDTTGAVSFDDWVARGFIVPSGVDQAAAQSPAKSRFAPAAGETDQA